MQLTSELYAIADRFITGKVTLTQLEEWLVPWLVELLDLPSSSARDLVGCILGSLAEMGDGILTEAELRERLRELVYAEPFVVDEAARPIRVVTGFEAGNVPADMIEAFLSGFSVSATARVVETPA